MWVQTHSVLPSAAELCYELFLGLSSFSWLRDVAYNKDIAELLSSTSKKLYLSSFHTDHIMSWTKTQYERQYGLDVTRHHIFAKVDHFNAILSFYGNVHATREGWIWENLKEIENRVIMGEVDSMSGAIHLPDHWVSIVINFPQHQILYGDSLRNPIPRHVYCACEHWVRTLIQQSANLGDDGEINADELPTGHQTDGTSCGLFALNSIAHHHFGFPLLPSDPVPPACHQIEIALDIIGTMTVCIFSHSIVYRRM